MTGTTRHNDDDDDDYRRYGDLHLKRGNAAEGRELTDCRGSLLYSNPFAVVVLAVTTRTPRLCCDYATGYIIVVGPSCCWPPGGDSGTEILMQMRKHIVCEQVHRAKQYCNRNTGAIGFCPFADLMAVEKDFGF